MQIPLTLGAVSQPRVVSGLKTIKRVLQKVACDESIPVRVDNVNLRMASRCRSYAVIAHLITIQEASKGKQLQAQKKSCGPTECFPWISPETFLIRLSWLSKYNDMKV